MAGPAPHTAEEATSGELWRASGRLLVMLLVLVALVVPLIRELPLGPTTRTGMLAWLLVGLALYWMYAGLGYRAVLMIQLFIFSAAAVLLSTKVALVLLGIRRLSVLRRSATVLIVLGTVLAVVNLGSMLVTIYRRRRAVQRMLKSASSG
jgi:hypothetical protein